MAQRTIASLSVLRFTARLSVVVPQTDAIRGKRKPRRTQKCETRLGLDSKSVANDFYRRGGWTRTSSRYSRSAYRDEMKGADVDEHAKRCP